MCLFCLCVLVLITWRTLYYFSCLHEDLHEHPISSQNAVKMKCRPDFIYYFRCALQECHFTTSRQLLDFPCVLCWLHEEPLNFPDYMKTSVIIQLQAGSWWRWHDDPTMPATFLYFTVIWTYLDYLSPPPYWLEHNCPLKTSVASAKEYTTRVYYVRTTRSLSINILCPMLY